MLCDADCVLWMRVLYQNLGLKSVLVLRRQNKTVREVDSALPKVRAARDHLLTQFFGQQGTTYERAKSHGDVFKQTLTEYLNNHTKTSGFWNEQGSLEPS